MKMTAEDADSQRVTVLVEGRSLACCTALDQEAGTVTVLVVQPSDRNGKPISVVSGGEFVRDCLKVPFEVRWDHRRPDDWIYWTGEGWCDHESRLIPGPLATRL